MPPHLAEVPRLTKADGVLLGIDPATVSGWAYYRGAHYIGSGTTRTPAGRRAVVEKFVEMAGPAPRVAVMEAWTPGGWKSHTSLVRASENRGRWLELLEGAGVPIVSVYTQTWRTRVHGKRYSNKTMESKDWKALAVRVVHAMHGIEVGHDEAEAILIGRWGSLAREVALALDPRLETTPPRGRLRRKK